MSSRSARDSGRLLEPRRLECGAGRECELAGIRAAILGLERRGWVREDPQDAGMQISTSEPLPGGAALTIAFRPGISVGDPTMLPEQHIVDAGVAPSLSVNFTPSTPPKYCAT